MEQIWAPWRMEYIRMEKPKGCFLCDGPIEDNDEGNLILYRGKWNFVVMNNIFKKYLKSLSIILI